MGAPENPYAYPHVEHGNYEQPHSGMTLRDWFAGQMIGQCVHNALCADGSWDPANVAHHAYLVADALLVERSLPAEPAPVPAPKPLGDEWKCQHGFDDVFDCPDCRPF